MTRPRRRVPSGVFKVGRTLLVVALLAPAIAGAADGGTPVDQVEEPRLKSDQLQVQPASPTPSSMPPSRLQREAVRYARFQWEPWSSLDEAASLVSGAIETSVRNETLGRWNVGGCGAPTCTSSRAGFHPGTRVIVETHSLSRRVTRRDESLLSKFQSDFRNRGYWLYRNCFEATARDTESRGGDVWLRVQVSKGSVHQSQIVSTTINRRSIAVCVRDSTRLIQVSHSENRGSTFALRVRLFPGDVPLASTRHQATGVEQLNPNQFGAMINPIRGAIEECAKQGLRRDPALWGRLSLQMHVRQDGHIGDVQEFDSHFPDQAVVECCRAAMLDKSLSRPTGVGELRLAVRVGDLVIASPDRPVAPPRQTQKLGN